VKSPEGKAQGNQQESYGEFSPGDAGTVGGERLGCERLRLRVPWEIAGGWSGVEVQERKRRRREVFAESFVGRMVAGLSGFVATGLATTLFDAAVTDAPVFNMAIGGGELVVGIAVCGSVGEKVAGGIAAIWFVQF